MTTGNVEITILDGTAGVVSVPATKVCAVLGCSTSGTVGAIVATTNPATVASTYGYGPLVEAACQVLSAGGTVLCVRVHTDATKKGTASAVVHTGTGTTVCTVSLDGTYGAYNDYYLILKCITGGAVGSAGITFQISLDAGRTYGETIALGTASSYAITGTGITLNFSHVGATDFVAGDTYQVGTVAQSWVLTDGTNKGLKECLALLQASPYAITGWGSMLIVGGPDTGAACAGASATAIDGYLSTMATGYVYTRAIISARDASPVSAYGGTGETETAWIASLTSDYSAVAAKRICACAGHYNYQGQVTTAAGGASRYRLPLSLALAMREVQIPAQRHAGYVADGALSGPVIDPLNDATDGWIYHDERVNPGLDTVRFTTVTTRVGLQGDYCKNPNLMSAVGSDFRLLPLGNVMDVACGIVHTTGQLRINSDIRLNTNGTIDERDARALESEFRAAIDAGMTSAGMISGVTVKVDRTNNIRSTSIVKVTVTINQKGYILEEDVTIGFQPST